MTDSVVVEGLVKIRDGKKVSASCDYRFFEIAKYTAFVWMCLCMLAVKLFTCVVSRFSGRVDGSFSASLRLLQVLFANPSALKRLKMFLFIAALKERGCEHNLLSRYTYKRNTLKCMQGFIGCLTFFILSSGQLFYLTINVACKWSCPTSQTNMSLKYYVTFAVGYIADCF